LRSLVSTAEQDHDPIAVTAIVDAVSGPELDSQLEDLADALRVSEVSEPQPRQPGTDSGTND
jgi:hypothetical protein